MESNSEQDNMILHLVTKFKTYVYRHVQSSSVSNVRKISTDKGTRKILLAVNKIKGILAITVMRSLTHSFTDFDSEARENSQALMIHNLAKVAKIATNLQFNSCTIS